MLLKIRKSNNLSLSNITLKELPCWCFLITIFLIKGFDLSISSSSSLIILGFFIILSLPKIILDNYNLKTIFIYFLVILIGTADFIYGKSEAFLFLGITLLVCRGLNPKKILKLGFYVLTTCLILSVLFSLLGFIDNKPFEIFREGEGIVERYAFGFTHPNAFHLSFFICTTLYLILFYRKSNIFIIILLAIADFIVYYFTKSRTGLLLSLMAYALYYFFFRFKFFKELFIVLSPFLLLLCIATPFLLGLAYGHFSIINRLDGLLSGRIFYINYLLVNFDVPIIGSTVYNNYVNFDSGFVSLLYESGSLAFIIFVVLLFIALFCMYKRREYSLIFLLIVFAMYGITEAFFQSITSNISLFLLLFVLNRKKVYRKVRYVKCNNSVS